MYKKIKKILKITIIIFTIISLIFSIIVSQDTYHLGTCHEEHCAICAMIHIAQTISHILIAFSIYAIVRFLIYFFLSRLHKEKNRFIKSSLVFQKVQFNE